MAKGRVSSHTPAPLPHPKGPPAPGRRGLKINDEQRGVCPNQAKVNTRSLTLAQKYLKHF